MGISVKECRPENGPLSKEKLWRIIDLAYTELSEEPKNIKMDEHQWADTLGKGILEVLAKHSTAYKYLVSVTTVVSSLAFEGNENASVSHTVSTYWNPNKDGLFSCILGQEAKDGIRYLVTVTWIYKEK
ncbi:hypothetical protein NCAS_0E03370 [Naumovozyma castellii]|uniref:Topoisomerase I damage affected protein 2 n=1 Tax=Naumovozyma castellii TaxID=27288 RepID=G0VFY8_NAUCA|nr:hypothetical protein NCAS_0E03370 [Naumovozyma castellii CBS 4309]CCC70407.1 hypothetical protein NCAS_0E03370 [Naumovozyma castellii CBS 4309]